MLKCMNRVVRQQKTLAMLQWKKVAHHHQQVEKITLKIIYKLKRRFLSIGLNTWLKRTRESIATEKTEKRCCLCLKKMIRRWRSTRLNSAVRKWWSITVWYRNVKRLFDRILLNRSGNRRKKYFYVWKSSDEVLKQTLLMNAMYLNDKMKRVGKRLMKSYQARAYDKWKETWKESKIRRLYLLKTTTMVLLRGMFKN